MLETKDYAIKYYYGTFKNVKVSIIKINKKHVRFTIIKRV